MMITDSGSYFMKWLLARYGYLEQISVLNLLRVSTKLIYKVISNHAVLTATVNPGSKVVIKKCNNNIKQKWKYIINNPWHRIQHMSQS